MFSFTVYTLQIIYNNIQSNLLPLHCFQSLYFSPLFPFYNWYLEGLIDFFFSYNAVDLYMHEAYNLGMYRFIFQPRKKLLNQKLLINKKKKKQHENVLCSVQLFSFRHNFVEYEIINSHSMLNQLSICRFRQCSTLS